jgi:hypothetical protein
MSGISLASGAVGRVEAIAPHVFRVRRRPDGRFAENRASQAPRSTKTLAACSSSNILPSSASEVRPDSPVTHRSGSAPLPCRAPAAAPVALVLCYT